MIPTNAPNAGDIDPWEAKQIADAEDERDNPTPDPSPEEIEEFDVWAMLDGE